VRARVFQGAQVEFFGLCPGCREGSRQAGKSPA